MLIVFPFSWKLIMTWYTPLSTKHASNSTLAMDWYIWTVCLEELGFTVFSRHWNSPGDNDITGNLYILGVKIREGSGEGFLTFRWSKWSHLLAFNRCNKYQHLEVIYLFLLYALFVLKPLVELPETFSIQNLIQNYFFSLTYCI